MFGRVGRVVAVLGIALWLPLVWLAMPGQASAAARVALVVGNGDYGPEIGRLKNPANDARLMAETLEGLDFEVTLVTDADQKAMKRAIREFGQKLRETGADGIGLFFYAGHGVQVEGENYLLPIGAEVQAEGDVELEAVSAASVLSQMQFAGNAVNLVFLDACRNNPLTRSFRSNARGLARVDAPRGSFVGYSTAPGDVSVDGEAEHSPYTLALAEALKQPGVSIEEAHRAVRGKVLAATAQRQTPWDSSSLTGPVMLAQPVALVAPTEPPVAPAAPAPEAGAGANQQAELLFWESIKDSKNPATFEAYLKQFPDGIFAPLAHAKVDELKAASSADTTAQQQAAARAEAETVAWNSIKDSANPALFEAFLKQFPAGTFAPLAQTRLDELAAAKAQAEAKTEVAAVQQPEPPAAAPQPEAESAEPAQAKPAEPAPIQIEQLSGVYVAQKSANVRAAPRTDAKVIAKLAADQAVDATGKVAGADWLRVAVKGQEGFVSAKLMARSSAEEVAAWQALQAKPTEAAAAGFVAQFPKSHFRPRADALLVKLQAEAAPKIAAPAQPAPQAAEATQPAQSQPAQSQVAETQAAAPAETAEAAPAATQQAAVTPAPAPQSGVKIVRISSALREDVERYINNSQAFGTTYFRFLAVSKAGDRVGMSSCQKNYPFMADPCGGASNARDGARRIAIKNCGGPQNCYLLFEGANKIGVFEIEWY